MLVEGASGDEDEMILDVEGAGVVVLLLDVGM